MSQPLDIQIVRRARELISDPADWCQHAGGLDATGNPTGDVDAAVRFCAFGALIKSGWETGLLKPAAETAALNIAETMTGSDDPQALFDTNDVEGGHAAVLALFDAYLARAEQ